MKIRRKLAGCLALLFTSLTLYGQQDSVRNPKALEVFDIEKAPEFPGGEKAMMQFLYDHIKYPKLALENMVKGTVVISFVIDRDGSITDSYILKDIGAGCGSEALRVVNSMPTWIPGHAKGGPVRVKYSLPIHFNVSHSKLTQTLGDNLLTAVPPLYTEQETWDLIRTAAEVTSLSGPIKPEAPFSVANSNDRQFIKQLEAAFGTKLREKDKKEFISLKEVSHYFYQSQFAPEFHMGPNYSSKFARLLTSREDFDLHAEGLGVLGSLKIPQGFKVILYSKKKFKGKKLEINAADGAIEIPNLGEDLSAFPQIKNGDPALNWSYKTQSVQIIQPKKFPPRN
jgi:TonB family protein